MMPLKYLKDLDCWNLLSMVAMQSFLAIAAATARNDPPPSSNRPWAPLFSVGQLQAVELA
jgi:hypothetical protein